ncbi:carboxypeptidase-like regulatory domain-containing protein [Geobacter benzoatilyticus]|nr:carboxypeptidase-like regulatory domain-containing protein [Geobacter benzoatilyticus]
MMKIRLLTAILCMFAASVAVAAGPVPTGTVSGKFLGEGKVPLSKGSVVLFRRGSGPPPAPDRYWLVPDHVETMDDDGRFTVTVEEGTYFLAAIKRNDHLEIGPPRAGELFLIAADDKGKLLTFDVKGNGAVNVGTIGGARPISKETGMMRPGATAIEGRLVDGEGKPVEGAVVFAFTSQEMQGKPLYVSERSDSYGKYLLRVAEGGKYYLRVRSAYGGGAPDEGSIFATLGGDVPAAVSVTSGEVLKDVAIPVGRFERPIKGKGKR